MAIKYFNSHDGSILTDKTAAGEEAVRQGRAIAINCPDNIESWRLKVNLSTSQVIVYGGVEKTETQAIQQKADEDTAKKAVEKEILDLKMALTEKQEEERKALQATFNNLG
jgi:uncharacterized protein YgbK (DUF1537 family)